MTQHPIDLLPEFIRAKSLAGIRTGRYITMMALAVLIVVVAAMNVHIQLDRARRHLLQAQDQNNHVLAAESRIGELARGLDDVEGRIAAYDRIAMPVEITRVIATVVNRLPPSITIERFDLDASVRPIGRSPRSKGDEKPEVERRLRGEIAGFAASDREIADLISAIGSREPFEQVSLDFSRTRAVRERHAREFRMSFTIDLQRRFELVEAEPNADDEQEVAHVE